MPTFYVVLRRNAFLIFLLVVSALFMATGCGGGKSDPPKSDVQYPSGHFRGVIYATDSPASGETPLYTVDFVQPINGGYIDDPNNSYPSAYRSSDGTTAGRIRGIFVYSSNGTIPVLSFILAETYRNSTALSSETDTSYYPVFGPPNNNDTHYEGVLIEFKPNTEASAGPRHKAVFDKVP